MHFQTMGPHADSAFTQPGSTMIEQASHVDVSRQARRLCLSSRVLIEAEAFGVLVTRRPGAGASALSSYEEARLLDVLVHMKDALVRCEEGNGECEFPVWTISSDARDVKPRAIWITLQKEQDESYRLAMSDV